MNADQNCDKCFTPCGAGYHFAVHILNGRRWCDLCWARKGRRAWRKFRAGWKRLTGRDWKALQAPRGWQGD